MAAPSGLSVQSDFTSGEIDPSIRRDADNPFLKTGARQMSNWRILNSKKASNRSGRRALFSAGPRSEEILMGPGATYYLVFGNGTLSIRDSTGTQVFSEGGKPWSASTAKNVRWAVYQKTIYVTFAGMVPRILTWDGATTWTAANFAETVNGNQKRTLFYRLAPKGITLTPAASTGLGVGIVFSANVLVAGMVGTRIRYGGCQMTIASVTNGTTGTADINESLVGAQQITFGVAPPFVSGDQVSQPSINGIPTGATGVVTAVGAFTIDVTLTSATSFGVSGIGLDDRIYSSSANANPTSAATIAPPASVVWDQEVMNSYQGWPQSVFVDQNRIGFCNFPSVPTGIAWSSVTDIADFYPDAFANDGLATDSIFELAPNKSQVQDIVPGMDGSEFVFCDNRLYYIPISETNPLKPGSVAFKVISEDECGNIQPQRAGEFIIFATGGLNQLMAINIFGAYTRAYKTDSITDLSAHLFNDITAIAVMKASATFAERYIAVLNGDGTFVIGRYQTGKNNELSGNVGWTPWSGNGTGTWVACKGANILFTSTYAPNGIGVVRLTEVLDDSRYLDASQLYNTQPSGLPIPGGKGPLWYLAGGTVDLMDGPNGTRMMGTYTIDANGFLIPQNNAGEDFTSVNLVCGQAWTAVLEPFIPPAQGGQDVGQLQGKRYMSEFRAFVFRSTGFVLAKLWGGDLGPNLPASGTIMQQRRIPTWFQGEDPTQEPILREGSWFDRPSGASHDPRESIIKDTPGPLIIEQIVSRTTV